jgi:hypothetical protein
VNVRLVHGGGRWARLAVVAIALVTPLVHAGPAAADTTLQVDAGYGGAFVPGKAVPVRVAISADRLLRGTLEVVVGAATPVELPVEVPGGSQKQFLVVAGTALQASPVVSARLRQDGQVVTKDVPLRAAGDQELVGLLPGVLAGRGLPGPAPLAVDVGTARFAALGDAELQQAPDSLGPLSTIGMDAGELAGLAPQARAGVLSWIEHGGRLLVDAERGRPIAGLPDDWQPGAGGRASAGLGEVVATGGAMAAGRWANLVEPASTGSTSNALGAAASAAASLASEAGLRSPRLGWLVGFLAVYVILVGPVLFFAVRRRRRPELAWVAVPLVAILFSTGSYVVGRNVRKATELVHGTVLSMGTTGPTASTYVGVFSRSGASVRLGFPAGWSTTSLAADVTGPARPASVTLTSGGPDARIPLDAGQFGLVAAAGPASSTGALQVSASVGPGGGVVGTVHNGTGFTLDDVAVLAGADGVRLGGLVPGQTSDWTVANPAAAGMGPPEFRLWGNLQGTGAPDMSLWQAATQVGGTGFRGLGSVVVAGWTREFVPSVRVDGRLQRPQGKTVVVARAPVHSGGATDPIEAAVRQDVVRDPFNGTGLGVGPGPSVVRFVLPAGVPAAGLALHSPFGQADIWRDGAWQPAACEDAGCTAAGSGLAVSTGRAVCPPTVPCPPAPPTTALLVKPGLPGAALAVPESAVRDGVVYARVNGPVSLSAGTQMSLGRAP